MDNLDSSIHHHVSMQHHNQLVHKKDWKIEFHPEAFHLPFGNLHENDELEECAVLTRAQFSYWQLWWCEILKIWRHHHPINISKPYPIITLIVKIDYHAVKNLNKNLLLICLPKYHKCACFYNTIYIVNYVYKSNQ